MALVDTITLMQSYWSVEKAAVNRVKCFASEAEAD